MIYLFLIRPSIFHSIRMHFQELIMSWSIYYMVFKNLQICGKMHTYIRLIITLLLSFQIVKKIRRSCSFSSAIIAPDNGRVYFQEKRGKIKWQKNVEKMEFLEGFLTWFIFLVHLTICPTPLLHFRKWGTAF